MYKKLILSVLLMSILIPSVLSFSAISRVFVNEPLSTQEPEVFVAVSNPTSTDYDETKVRVYMDELGVMLYTNPFELKQKTTVLKRMQGTFSGVEPGLHYLRVVVSGKVRDVKYVPVLVY